MAKIPTAEVSSARPLLPVAALPVAGGKLGYDSPLELKFRLKGVLRPGLP